MNQLSKIGLGGALLLAMTGGGYWLGSHHVSPSNAVSQGQGKATSTGKKLLYYRNPMGLPDTSPVPKKDAMGMDYVAVYDGEAVGANVLNLSLDKVQKLGVQSEAVALRDINKTLRVTGRIEIDESRTYTIAPKFEGWVERLYVNTTGQMVRKGQPLFEVYSPELVSAQQEYVLAKQGLAALQNADAQAQAGMRQLADASRARLKNWDINDLSAGTNRVTFRAPVTGVVLEKKAVQGMRFMPGDTLYQIADLASVWVLAEVPEQDIAQVQLGSPAQVVVEAYPAQPFNGKVDFIYPTLNSATRTVPVRIQVANHAGLLKPAMFANATIAVSKGNKVLTVPTSAVIDSGTQQVVLVRLDEGRFEPRTVSLGNRSNDYVEVLSGIAAGEQVVTSANFLIDAESNLKAALGGMSEASTSPQPLPASPLQGRSGGSAASSVQPKTVGHQAHGVLEAINEDGTLSITHEAIKSLGWPSMTMDFALANTALASGIKPGSTIDFEIVERGKDEWVITQLHAAPQEASHAEHRH